MLQRLSLAAVVLAACTPIAGIAQDVVVFEGVNVVPMDEERVLEAQTVIIRDGRIESIVDADAAEIPGDALVIEGEGRFLVPGLAEMHAHSDFVKLHPGLTREEFDAAVAAARDAGIELAGHVSEEVGVERALEAGQATIDHLDGYVQYLVPADERDAAPAGFFGIGLADRVDLARIPEAVEATRAAGVHNVPTQTLLEHWGAPSPTADELAARPEMVYVSPQTRQQWLQSKRQIAQSPGYTPERARQLIDVRRRLVKALHDEEPSLLLLGSDAPQVFNVPGFSLHHELDAIVAAGLSPYEALRTGTVRAAAFFGAEGELGRIAPGLAADLVLVDGNPLEDVSAMREPAGVMIRGRWLDREELDRRLDAIAERYR